MNKYIMWDFDHTLSYRSGMWTQTAMDVLSENKINNIPKEKIKSMMKKGFPWQNPGISHKELMGDLQWWDYIKMYFIKSFMELGIPADKSTQIAKELKDKYLDKSGWEVYSDSVKALEILSKKGYKHIILSNHVPELSLIIKNLNLSSYFEKIFTSGLIGYEKPHKKIFEYALDFLPKNAKAIMVGDNYYADILGANQSGLKAILVRKSNDFNYPNYSKHLDSYFINLIDLVFERI